MKIELFSLCDAATEGGGKMNILGAFDTITAQTVPALHPACALVFRIRFEKAEEGQHPFRLLIIDQDGHPLIPAIDGQVGVQVPPGIDSISANLVVNFQGLQIKSFGKFRIDLSVDNQLRGSIPLFVRKA